MNQTLKNLPLFSALGLIVCLLGLVGTMTIGIDCSGNPNQTFSTSMHMATNNQCKY